MTGIRRLTMPMSRPFSTTGARLIFLRLNSARASWQVWSGDRVKRSLVMKCRTSTETLTSLGPKSSNHFWGALNMNRQKEVRA